VLAPKQPLFLQRAAWRSYADFKAQEVKTQERNPGREKRRISCEALGYATAASASTGAEHSQKHLYILSKVSPFT